MFPGSLEPPRRHVSTQRQAITPASRVTFPLDRHEERFLRRAWLWALAALALAVLLGCGGGGGGGGDDGPGSAAPGAQAVTLEGIFFRTPGGALTPTPPVEAPDASPPTVGAPLDQVVVFDFSDVPEGPFDATTLPVFTTPALADPTLGIPAGQSVVLAKGSYLRVDDLVEFRPFVPTAPLQLSLGAPPAAVPGLLPGSTYVARVNGASSGSALGNLEGPGAETSFGTTSNPAAFYPAGTGEPTPPRVVASEPPSGATDVDPNLFGAVALDTGAPLVPPGPEVLELHYDHALLPTADNLSGDDVDGDGLAEPVFFAAARATPLLVGHTVPAGALGAHDAFGALSGLAEGQAPAADGADLLVHAGPADLPAGTPQPALPGAPASLVVAHEPALAFAAFERPGDSDLLGVFGPVLGDAAFARLGTLADGVTPALFDTGLAQLTGLVRLPGGRLLGYDRATRRVHELRPEAAPRPGSTPSPGPSAPRFTALLVGDEQNDGFASAPLDNPLLGGPLDVLDLAAAPSGRLTALARLAPGAFPSLVRLAPVDRAGTGDFAADGAQFLAAPGDVLATFGEDYTDVVFVGEHELLALAPAQDRIDRVDLQTGAVSTAVQGVAGFGLPPGAQPPARCLAVGELELALLAELAGNADDGAAVHLRPRALLPLGAELQIRQRNTLESLAGYSEYSTSLPADTTALGAREVLRVSTAAPAAGPGAVLADHFEEQFVDQVFASPTPVGPHPPAEWAEPLAPGATPSGFLRAARGAEDLAELGDFLPQSNPGYQPLAAYVPSDDDDGELDLDTSGGGFVEILLDTTAQTLPLPGGATPGITAPTTITDGVFVFRDIVIPAGVRLVVRGANPLELIATGDVRIDGMIDVSGTDGFSDDSFNSGFLPVRGGPGGPGGGRGGDGHPTLFDPDHAGTIDQYVTPERGERGRGPWILPGGSVVMKPIGGHGGLSTVGYTPFSDMPEGFTQVNDMDNTEHSRPPGGGGGSMYTLGQRSRDGSGAYLVQSSSTWSPFDKCQYDDNKRDALYGNEENRARGLSPNHFLQCVYFTGQFPHPDPVKPGAAPGDPVFTDGDPTNDHVGPGGELPVLVGGQGGGGGGSRVDSLDHQLWSQDSLGAPNTTGPPFYPKLFFGIYTSPTLYDAKGAGGGGGGGALMIRAYGDIEIGKTAYLDASGGHGGGGEALRNSSLGGGGGGGSGGTIVLQAGGAIRIEGEPGHVNAGYVDVDGDLGAALDVSGGFGRDARTAPTIGGDLATFTYDYTRSDGGSGGFGLIQLQAGADEGVPEIDEGAFLFARQRAVLKLGKWTGDPFKQFEHFSFVPGGVDNPPDELRYIDMLHYRYFRPQGGGFAPTNNYYVLNGSFPPLIPSADGDNGQGFVNEWPEGSGQLWADTRMLESPHEPGTWLVEEPEPSKVMQTYNGFDENFFEINNPPDHPEFPNSPGATYAGQRIPFGQLVQEPSGRPLFAEHDGESVFDPANTIDRLPVVPLDLAPPVLSPVTTGTSAWLDFGGAVLRARDALGRTPPFFEPVHGTYNLGTGPVPAGKDGRVILAGKVPLAPARFVAKAGPFPLGPGLFGQPGDPPFNDLSVDSFDLPFPEEDAVTDNAAVILRFQGAHPVRSGSHVPDASTLSPWVTDLTLLDGYPLVRFQVLFDLAIAPETFPFDETSFRPQVDYVRLRMRY